MYVYVYVCVRVYIYIYIYYVSCVCLLRSVVHTGSVLQTPGSKEYALRKQARRSSLISLCQLSFVKATKGRVRRIVPGGPLGAHIICVYAYADYTVRYTHGADAIWRSLLRTHKSSYTHTCRARYRTS